MLVAFVVYIQALMGRWPSQYEKKIQVHGEEYLNLIVAVACYKMHYWVGKVVTYPRCHCPILNGKWAKKLGR